MDLSPGQQKAVFALVVVVLAALGYWLIVPRVSHSQRPGPAVAHSVPHRVGPVAARVGRRPP